MNIKTLNTQIKLEDILYKLGFLPARTTEEEAWYLSPFREETQASFKIDRTNQVWFDHGAGIGGKNIELIMHYLSCSVQQALAWAREQNFIFLFQPQAIYSKKEDPVKKYQITRINTLKNKVLIDYGTRRGISPTILKRYCKEIYFTINTHKLFALCFANNRGGYEVRSKYTKICINKKYFTYINSCKSYNREFLILFEGFMDLLSFLTMYPNQERNDFLVLNGTVNVMQSLIVARTYKTIYSFLDTDYAGKKALQLYTENIDNVIHDMSGFYRGCKDLNEFLMKNKSTVSF